MKEYILVSGFVQGLLEKHKNFSKNWKEIDANQVIVPVRRHQPGKAAAAQDAIAGSRNW